MESKYIAFQNYELKELYSGGGGVGITALQNGFTLD